METLAARVRPRILVDKTPSMVYRVKSAAVDAFPSAPYIICCVTRGGTANRS